MPRVYANNARSQERSSSGCADLPGGCNKHRILDTPASLVLIGALKEAPQSIEAANVSAGPSKSH